MQYSCSAVSAILGRIVNLTSLVALVYFMLVFTGINPWDSQSPSMNQGSGACLWTPVPQHCPAPSDRYKHASCAHRGHVYLLGGREKCSLRDFWKYNVGMLLLFICVCLLLWTLALVIAQLMVSSCSTDIIIQGKCLYF